LRRTLVVILLLLAAQFLLGMAVNLFVKVPTDHPGARPAEYFSGVVQRVTWSITAGPFWLILHAALGLALVVAGIAALARAIASRRRALVVSTAIGALAVLAAGFNGGSYLNYHEDFSSMVMAGGFALAMAAYTFALYFAEPVAA
jgi:hypothetical protein